MSITQQIDEIDADLDELAESLMQDTFPGPSNDKITDGLTRAMGVFPVVVQDLNNWFYAVDLRVYNGTHIGIPMRYRWTIIRWAQSDMDGWLEKNGWTDRPHRNADSYTREKNELEARYRKEYAGVTVDCNFLVHMPDVVFEKLQSRSSKSMKKRKKEKSSLEEVVEARRG